MLLVKLALKESGIIHVLTRFGTGKDAVEELCGTISREVAVPDVILLDLNTPRSDGFEVLMKLQLSPRLSKVPIAILTSSRARSDKNRAAVQGVRYVEKPSQLSEFLSAVGRAVQEMLSGLEPSKKADGAIAP